MSRFRFAVAEPAVGKSGNIRDTACVIDGILTQGYLSAEVALNFEDGAALAWLHERAEVLDRTDDENGMRLNVRISPEAAARFEQTFETDIRRHPN